MSVTGVRDVSVLVADDHAAVRRTLRQLLQDSGMDVVGEAANGEEAVRSCALLHPRIVVLDISMPLLNGFEAARQIGRLSPSTKIVFLTGHILKEYEDGAFRAGGVAFVTKNNAAFGLLDAIEAVLQGKLYNGRGSVA